MNGIVYTQSEIAKMQHWLGDMGRQILGRFDNGNAKQKALFPCLFTRKVFAQGMVKFLPIAYVQDKVQYDLECFAQGLKQCLKNRTSNISLGRKIQYNLPIVGCI